MSVKYEILKRLVKAVNIKKMWTGMSTEELLENRRRQNAKNRIPNLKDDAFDISRIEIMGCPVLKLIHKKRTERVTLFLIGGGMISAPRPGSVRKALQFARETGLDVFVPYYPLCTDCPLTRAYEMIHETYRVMLQDYKAENISVLGTSSGGNLARHGALYQRRPWRYADARLHHGDLSGHLRRYRGGMAADAGAG